MKILRVELFNIGSYEGFNIIEINNNDKNIVLIGGKNGAGKTTLFESIKLGLYGYRESGYQIMNSLYKKRIKSLINDYAKLETKTNAFIHLEIEIFNGQENDIYLLKREWNLTTEIFEDFTVIKNGLELNEEEIEEFTSYLLNLIPPELFNLYFFDGEQIADDFLSNTGNEKIKEAFLVLCGYDTFELMLQNFKRISYNKKTSNSSTAIYLESKEKYEEAKKAQKDIHEKIENSYKELERIGTKIATLEQEYKKNGGITLEEWNKKIAEIDNLEKQREVLNTEIKKFANDAIPFIILESEISRLLTLIENEEEYYRRKNLYNELKIILPLISKKTLKKFNYTHELSKFSDEFQTNLLREVKVENKKTILKLSHNEQNSLKNIINSFDPFAKDTVINNRLSLKNSLAKTKELKSELDNCNVTNVQYFMKQKEDLSKEKETLLNEIQSLLSERTNIDEEFIKISEQFKHDTKVLEDELKSNSIVDISSKAILFLESLQKDLLKEKMHEVENLVMQKLNELKRKETFIDKIVIDEDFDIHVYKRIIIKCDTICSKIQQMGISRYKEENGVHHCNDILSITNTKTLDEFIEKYQGSNEIFDVMHEFEKQRMSKGEKQIFIMSFYWALMTLSDKRIPFMMDTPFARIDKEHRDKITEKFFNCLPGQVFIFSTDEEIVGEHFEIIKDKLNKTFLLENINNKKTTIIENKYFC